MRKKKKPTKIPQKSNEWSMFWLSLAVHWSFSVVSRVFHFFLRIQWYFGHFKSFRGHCGRFGGILVIFQGFRKHWTFVVHFSSFGSFKGTILGVLLYLQDLWYFGNSASKINFFLDKKITLKSLEQPTYSQINKITKIPPTTTKCPKKTPPKRLI